MKITIHRIKALSKAMVRVLKPLKLIRSVNVWQTKRLVKKCALMRNNKDNGTYYFLGNFHQHMSHVMPLYKVIGGIVVVLSDDAKREVESYGVQCVCIENQPDIWLDLDERIEKTISFLNERAKVVLLFDAFYWNGLTVETPTLWLSHGSPTTKVLFWDQKRLSELDKLTVVASLGEFFQTRLSNVVDKGKLKKISTERIDELIGVSSWPRNVKDAVLNDLGLSTEKKTVSYIPTYWGPSSLMDTGLKIIDTISNRYNVVFWPHPQTPLEIVTRYRKITEKKEHIVFAQDKKTLSIYDIYAITDVFISDHTSSVVADVMVLGKPLIFAFGEGEHFDTTVQDSPIRTLVERSTSVTKDSAGKIETTLNNFHESIIVKVLRRVLIYRFVWQPNGGVTKRIIKTISLIKKN